MERSQLISAGLGKTLNMLECGDSAELHADIVDAFPQLADAGGYELLRVSDRAGRGRGLEVFQVPRDGYRVSYLKAVALQAKT